MTISAIINVSILRSLGVKCDFRSMWAIDLNQVSLIGQFSRLEIYSNTNNYFQLYSFLVSKRYLIFCITHRYDIVIIIRLLIIYIVVPELYIDSSPNILIVCQKNSKTLFYHRQVCLFEMWYTTYHWPTKLNKSKIFSFRNRL